MKYLVVVIALLLIACGTTQAQLPLGTETPIPLTSTPQVIEVTRIVKVEQTVVVTAAPEPLLAQECFDKAITQSDLNNCAAQERFNAQTELENLISQIRFSSEEKLTFNNLQKEWLSQVESDCNFFYEQSGSMGPMQRSMCIASRIRQRIKELKIVYLPPDG
jgi:uncharacterized protein YecT (DUF1311 family)